MTNVIKRHSISSDLAQKMVNAAVAKARELGVTENVAILDDGGNLNGFSRMDGASIPTIEMAQNKAHTALFGVSIQDFSTSSGRPVAFGRHPHSYACRGVGCRLSDQGEGRSCRANTLRTLLHLRKSYRSSSNKRRDKFSWAK